MIHDQLQFFSGPYATEATIASRAVYKQLNNRLPNSLLEGSPQLTKNPLLTAHVGLSSTFTSCEFEVQQGVKPV